MPSIYSLPGEHVGHSHNMHFPRQIDQIYIKDFLSIKLLSVFNIINLLVIAVIIKRWN